MSKVFEALRKLDGDLPETIMSALEQQQAAEHPPVRQPEMGAAAPEAEPMPPFTAALPKDTLPDLVRELPIHIASSAPLLPFDDTDDTAAEQYRIIRTRVVQRAEAAQILLVSSTGPADGKTVTAINLAGALSLKLEGSVLLADTDFRRSMIHTQLGLPLSPGLTEVLTGAATLEQALIRVRQFPNLYCITAGEPLPNPSEVLDSSRWGALCDRLRNLFRYVVADSPPVASVADYELLQTSCDGIVLVVRPDHTNRAACLSAINSVPKGKLIGAVMNCVSGRLLGRFSPSYYGYPRASAGRPQAPR